MTAAMVCTQVVGKGRWLLSMVGLLVNTVYAADMLQPPLHNQGAMMPATPISATSSMQGGNAPNNARSPHAYANGLSLTTGPYLLADVPRLFLMDEDPLWGVSVNRFELVEANTNSNDSSVYDAQVWYGYTFQRAVIKAEGAFADDSLNNSHTELLYSHAITAFWDIQSGIRHDSSEGPDRNWWVLGFQGVLPYWFEIDGAVYVGEHGRSMLQIEAEYELLFTQRLILQPRVELTFYGQQDEAMGVGSSLSSAIAGLRLRYEITRQLAPYIGVAWESQFGDTADFTRATGGDRQNILWLAGLRFWF